MLLQGGLTLQARASQSKTFGKRNATRDNARGRRQQTWQATIPDLINSLRRSPYCLSRLWSAKGGALAIRDLCGNVFSGHQVAIVFTLVGASGLRKQSANRRSGKQLRGFASQQPARARLVEAELLD